MQIFRSIKYYAYFKLLTTLGVLDVLAYREIYRDQAYKRLYNRIKPNTLLLDIGASIGDTAIYFAMHPNTREVWSYEPNKKRHAQALKNLKRAGFDKKVKLHNIGLEHLNKVLSVAKEPIAIKCDIEGGEYSIFDKDVDLSKVYAIMMEYHYGIAPIVKNLKAKGFKVDYTKPKQTTLKMHETGYIYANR